MFVSLHPLCVFYPNLLSLSWQIVKATRPLPGWGPRLKENRTGEYYDNYGYDASEDKDAQQAYSKDTAMNGDYVEKGGIEFHKM